MERGGPLVEVTMTMRATWPSVGLTLLALAIVYGVGATFFTVELERLVERTIAPHIAGSSGAAAMSREIH